MWVNTALRCVLAVQAHIPVFGVRRNIPGPISAAVAGSELVAQACNYDACRAAQNFYNLILCNRLYFAYLLRIRRFHYRRIAPAASDTLCCYGNQVGSHLLFKLSVGRSIGPEWSTLHTGSLRCFLENTEHCQRISTMRIDAEHSLGSPLTSLQTN